MAERSQLTVNGSRFTVNEDGPRLGSKPILGYDQDFDQEAYQAINSQQQFLKPQEFARRKDQLDLRTEHNLETALGERFNLQISQVVYRLEDGLIISAEHDEPFIEIIRRGQKYRQEHGSGDVEREKAEVEGFEKVQKILTDRKYQDAKVIIISPRGKTGSMYQHNFFDVWEKRGDQIIMSRYASSASCEEFREAADHLDSFNSIGQSPEDADFKRNPLITYKNISAILEFLQLDLNAMNSQEYEKLVETVATLRLNYISALANGDWQLAQKIYNATLNFADDVFFNPRYDQFLRDEVLQETPTALVAIYGSQQVRPVLAGCGLQASFAVQNPREFISALFPYSGSDFTGIAGLNAGEKTLKCKCPFCGLQVEAIISSGKISCPQCKNSAPYEC